MTSPTGWLRLPCVTAFAISSWAPSATSSATEDNPERHINLCSSRRARGTAAGSAGKTEAAWNRRPPHDVGSAVVEVPGCTATPCSCGRRAFTTVAAPG